MIFYYPTERSRAFSMVGYSEEARDLRVVWRDSGEEYSVSPVLPALVAGFMFSPNMGAFYNDRFKDGPFAVVKVQTVTLGRGAPGEVAS